MNLKDLFFAALGRKPTRLKPIIEVDHDPEARAKTEEALPRAPLAIEPGQALVGLTTDDIDARTGRPYVDYRRRRARREDARKAGAEAAELCPLDWDISPR